MHLLGRSGLDDPARRPDGKLLRRRGLELERHAFGARVAQAERGGDILADLEAEAELVGCGGVGGGGRGGFGGGGEGRGERERRGGREEEGEVGGFSLLPAAACCCLLLPCKEDLPSLCLLPGSSLRSSPAAMVSDSCFFFPRK